MFLPQCHVFQSWDEDGMNIACHFMLPFLQHLVQLVTVRTSVLVVCVCVMLCDLYCCFCLRVT